MRYIDLQPRQPADGYTGASNPCEEEQLVGSDTAVRHQGRPDRQTKAISKTTADKNPDHQGQSTNDQTYCADSGRRGPIRRNGLSCTGLAPQHGGGQHKPLATDVFIRQVLCE